MNSLISSALSISFCLSFLLSVCQRRWRHGFSLGWRRELIRSCQGVTSGKSSDGELALSPGLAVWMVLHIKGNKGKTKTSMKRDRNRWEKQVVTSLVKWKVHPKMAMGQQAPKFKFGQITSTWFNLINSKIFTILHHPYCCYVYTLYNLFAHSYCTYLLLLLFIKSTVYSPAHLFYILFIYSVLIFLPIFMYLTWLTLHYWLYSV